MSAPERPRCAVVDCIAPGKPHACLYDGSYHGHGRVHYWCERAKATGHGLTFREGAWHLICDAHYEHLQQALNRHEGTVQS